MDFQALPDVLQDLVCLFCFNLPLKAVRNGVDKILEIKDMNLPFFFFRDKIWSWEDKCFYPSPTKVWMPIEYFGGMYRDLFDDDTVFDMIKIDTQGSEIDILKGGTELIKRTQVIMLEVDIGHIKYNLGAPGKAEVMKFLS